VTLATDRWLEMDLTWFDPDRPLDPQIEMLVARVEPLLRGIEGDRGIFFNVGWLVDLVTEWTGDPRQAIPTRSRRTARWAARTYADFKGFLDQTRACAARHDLPDLKIGVLFVGWGHVVWPPELKIYDFDSDWYDRHPELYHAPMSIIGMPDLWPIHHLHADGYPYAAYPEGLPEGAYFPEFFGAQWGLLSRYLGLDAIHLRDTLTGPMVYTRNGPYGTRAPDDPRLVEAFSQSVRDLYRHVKLANPDALVVGYSSAISPTADWRVGCVDFEALVADGHIDCWVEQTWGGAWQDWWHQLWKGWTFQLANLLIRGAMIARANQARVRPCRFYNLIETWDGWEPWDTIHQVPHKLRWAMWAFSHAAVLTPEGPRVPDGSYISWMNNGQMDLLSNEDVTMIVTHLNAAQANAASLEEVYGPAAVYNRDMMAWLSQTHPDWNVSEWVDDQAAMLMKWGVPVLSATRTEWLAEGVLPDAAILQTPGQLDHEARQAALDSPGPVLVTGRADILDTAICERLGIRPRGERVSAGFHISEGDLPETPPYDRPYIPDHQPVIAGDDTAIHCFTAQTPLLASRAGWIYWQPPDWSEPFNAFLPKYQLGSTFPHYRAALLVHQAAQAAGLSHVEPMVWSQPIALSMWRSAGRVYLLLGNLETGVLGDSRTPRVMTLKLSRTQLGLEDGICVLSRVDMPGQGWPDIAPMLADAQWLAFRVDLPPEQCAVFQVSPRSG
jgi:hypothetical protein